MAYQIKGGVIINDDRALIGVSTAGINTALYVGDSVANLITLDGETGNIDVSGTSTLDGDVTLGGNLSFVGATAGESVNGITTDISVSASATDLVTAEGIRTYVVDQIAETGGTLNFGGDSGSGAVDLSSQTFSIEGTNLEIETSAVNQTLTIGLTNEVAIAGSMTANKYYGDGSELTGITGSNVNLDGTDQSFNSLVITETVGYGLTVDNDAQIKGNLVMVGQIHGPSEFVIDPEVIGNNTGTVIIRGDLVVEGTEFIINSDTLQIADKQIGLATNVTNAALLEDSGITIGEPGSAVEQSFLWDFSSQSFQSSAGLGVTDGGGFYAGDTEILSLETLGSTVVNSSLTSVGTLTDLTVTGDINANGDIVGDNFTNISGINSVTATDFYGNGAGLTGINAGSVNLDGTDQNFRSLQLSGVGVALTVTNDAEIGNNLTVDGDITLGGDILPDSPGTGSVGKTTDRFLVVAATGGDFTQADIGSVNVSGVSTLTGNVELGAQLTFTGSDADEFVSGITTSLDESAGANEIATAEGIKDYVDAQIGGGGSVQAATIAVADNQDNVEYSVPFASATAANASLYSDSTQLKYNPSTGLLVAQDFNSLSDIRFKDNVETIDGAVAKLQQLRGVEFDWKHSPGSSVGVIAQEVKEVYPQLVTEGEEKITVNYNGLVGLLIQAVKEQADEIAALKEKLG
ncbi:hypothetical protein CC030809_00260 [Synechococcus phage S-CAM7]|uniref:Peptidase S74 domain-containing protein n=1 Tax=Synechococcus phage S-CAM7 TaxID=1883368 RepID=A0A7D5K8R8_9CAUD|nr:hypothetical protein CC030809_00260 [Synechococcus phage S-CAM7]